MQNILRTAVIAALILSGSVHVSIAQAPPLPDADPASLGATSPDPAPILPADTSYAESIGVQPLFLDVCWHGVFCGSFMQLGSRVNNAMFFLAPAICLAIFMLGAFVLTISAGRDQWVQTGKNMMKGSLLGLVVIVLSYAIYRMTMFVIYGGFT